MQEIKKRRIVIASVLKPANDTRMCAKIGATLALGHEVHVIGWGTTENDYSNLTLHGTGNFSRLSFARLLTPWRILFKALRLRPDIFIVCTHELLIPAGILKVLVRCRLWYDVQENYAKNIKYTKTFPWLLRPLIAGWIRLKERVAAPIIEYFLLAETSYETEMPFMRKRAVMILNKVRREDVVRTRRTSATLDKSKPLNLLFSGTIAESTGVFTAIDLAMKLNSIHPAHLNIVGFYPDEGQRKKLYAVCAGKANIELKGISQPVPHSTIMEAITTADLGIVSYPENPSTWTCIPTKLYEYMACKLPIILVNNPFWIELCTRCQAGIAFDPSSIDPQKILGSIFEASFYPSECQGIYWEEQEASLLTLV